MNDQHVFPLRWCEVNAGRGQLNSRRRQLTARSSAQCRSAVFSWVEATKVRLYDVGMSGCMWQFPANILCVTLSQVRTGDFFHALGRLGHRTGPSAFSFNLQRAFRHPCGICPQRRSCCPAGPFRCLPSCLSSSRRRGGSRV